jgi:hypothetical protein
VVWTRDSTARLAESLLVLLAEVDHTWPDRATGADGTIGDKKHAARGSDSDHNAWVKDSHGTGVVRAVDITTSGTVAQQVLDRVLTLARSGGHPALGPGAYAIFAGWRCYRCGKRFPHARLLVAHLIDLHDEAPAR